MNLRADRFGKLRLEKRYHSGGVIFLIPGLAIAALTARYGNQEWVKVLFYSVAALLVVAAALGFKGPYIVIPSHGGQDDLAIHVIDNPDQAEAFVFSINQSREADADTATNIPIGSTS